MNCIKRFSLALVSALYLVVSPASWSQDDDGFGLTIVPTLGFQWKNLDLSQTWVSTDNRVEKGGLDTTLPTYSLGLNFILNRWSLALKYEDVLEETSAKSDVPLTNSTYINFLNSVPDPKVGANVERSDFSVTLNYNAWRDLNVFAGYTNGETTIAPDRIVCAGYHKDLDDFTPEFETCNPEDESNVPYLTQFYVTGSSAYKQEYREDGWVIGAGYSWIVGPGALSFSAAYADMDGRYTDNFGDAHPTPHLARLANLSGDSTGTSLSLRWSAPISDRVSYYLDLRQQSYDLDSTNGVSGAWREAIVAEVHQKEKMTGFTMGIQMAL